MENKQFKQLNKKVDFIAQKVVGHDNRFEGVDKHFEQIDLRFVKVDERFDMVIKMLLNHEDRLERIETNMATKDDIRQINQTLDTLVKSNNDLREDHFCGMRWLKRMQEELGWHDSDIKRIKLVLNLV